MKIAIIGAGAMGSLFGGYLGEVADVWLYSTNKAFIEAVRKNGLHMTQREKSKYVQVHATNDAKEIGVVDVAIIYVKFGQTRQAIQDALPCIDKDTVVLTLQNGIGNVDIIKEYVPEEQIVYGLSALTSDVHAPGHIEMTTINVPDSPTYFWPLNGVVNEKTKKLEELMQKAGISAYISNEVDNKIWHKLMINCSENTMCAILRVKVGALIDTPAAFEMLKQIVYEVVDVAQAKGLKVSRNEGLKYVVMVSKAVYNHVPSMAIDVKNHRKTEIACLNEAVAAEGKRLGVATPMIETVARMIRTIEANYEELTF